MKSIVYGEVLCDIYPYKKVIGGVAFNFAAHLAQLDNEVYFVSGVGGDELGEDTLRFIKR